jgi:hypothetical protein
MGGLGSRFEHLHHGIRGENLRSVENELRALVLTGSCLQETSERIGIECLNEAGQPLAQLVVHRPFAA